MLGKEIFDDIFESVGIDSAEPVHDDFIVIRRFVGILGDMVNRNSVSSGSINGFPDHVGAGGERSTAACSRTSMTARSGSPSGSTLGAVRINGASSHGLGVIPFSGNEDSGIGTSIEGFIRYKSIML